MFTNRVNELCEQAKLGDLSAEDWKVFLFLKGLDSPDDADLRRHLLQFVELQANANKKVTLNDCYA